MKRRVPPHPRHALSLSPSHSRVSDQVFTSTARLDDQVPAPIGAVGEGGCGEIQGESVAGASCVGGDGMELGPAVASDVDEADEDLLKQVWLETLETARARYWASNPKGRGETRRAKGDNASRTPAHLGISDILGTVIGINAFAKMADGRDGSESYPSAVIASKMSPVGFSQEGPNSESTDVSPVQSQSVASLAAQSTQLEECCTTTGAARWRVSQPRRARSADARGSRSQSQRRGGPECEVDELL
jgi:hypothetical protein